MKKTLFAVIIAATVVGLCVTLFAAGPDTPQTPLWTTTAVAPTFTTGQVAIAATGAPATQIIAAPVATAPTARSLTLTNTGTVTIWIGPTNAVTTSTGKSLPAGATLTIDRCRLTGGVWGVVSSTAGSIDYLED